MSSSLRLLIVCALSLCALNARTPVSLSAGSSSEQSPTALERKAVVLRSPASAAVAIEAVRHLEEENWWERLEIQVKNVSRRAVYFLEVDLLFPEVINTEIDGARRSLIAPLTCGRRELMRKGNRAGLEDVPINPGDSHVFKIPSQYREAQGRLAVVKRVLIKVYDLSFGDETGFLAGTPFPSGKQ